MDYRTLEQQRLEFINQKFLATPLAGLIIWALIGATGIFFSDCRLGCIYWHGKYSISRPVSFQIHRRKLSRQEQAKKRIRYPFSLYCRAGHPCLLHCHPLLFDRLYLSSSYRRHTHGTYVVALFLDRKALGRHFSRPHPNYFDTRPLVLTARI